MVKQDPMNDTVGRNDIENARIAYQVASNLWSSGATEFWSKFNALLLANSIVIGSTVISLTASKPFLKFPIYLSIAGIMLCILWFLLTTRSFEIMKYWIYSTREIEEKFQSAFPKTVSRGADFTDGKRVSITISGHPNLLRMCFFGRLLRIQWVSYLAILPFLGIHILIIVISLTNGCAHVTNGGSG